MNCDPRKRVAVHRMERGQFSLPGLLVQRVVEIVPEVVGMLEANTET